MVKRKMIEIDEEKCDGCGQCAIACAEGALAIVDGKAKVVNEVFCDGLGACIGECPQGALRIVERDAPEFDESAVKKHLERTDPEKAHALGHGHEHAHAAPEPCGCPSAQPMTLRGAHGIGEAPRPADLPPELTNWPVQWKLVSPAMPFFKGADVLLAADCVPFAFRDFHGRFLTGKPVIIGCPKLDEQADYLERVADVFKEAKPRSVTVVRMQVPCCSGLTRIAKEAVRATGRDIPIKEIVIGIRGDVLQEC
ncbi:MAG: 4Fe-4S binding protein [Thermoplasmata archaeon]|jgi:Pyruvate/2-oxoacid:ferredoxin oxidoreductase delta subunit|nr:4Fe-4S binding protein [Thermoplasmata archaeon]